MKSEIQGQRLRIFVGESDRWEGRPLYESIVRAAREQGLAGASAIRGIEGFGARGRIHTVKILHLSEDLPIVIEILDRVEKIQGFLPMLDKMVAEGAITVENVNILVYQRDGKSKPDNDASQHGRSQASQLSGISFLQTTNSARKILELAKAETAKSHRVFFDSVDILQAMLRETEGVAGHVLTNLGIEAATVERRLREEVSREPPSDAFCTALDERSLAEANWLRQDCIGTEHLLLALCEIRPSAATDILMRLGARPRDICREVLTLLGRDDEWQRWLADHADM